MITGYPPFCSCHICGPFFGNVIGNGSELVVHLVEQQRDPDSGVGEHLDYRCTRRMCATWLNGSSLT